MTFSTLFFTVSAVLFTFLTFLYGLGLSPSIALVVEEHIKADLFRNSLKNVFIAASEFITFLFGRKLFSWRSIFVSLAISLGSFFVCMIVADVTLFYKLFFSIKSLENVLPYMNPFEIYIAPSMPDEPHYDYTEKAPEIISILFCFILEYIYVTKSRVLLRMINTNSSLLKVSFILVVDVASTLVSFLFLVGLLIFLSMFLICFVILALHPKNGIEIHFNYSEWFYDFNIHFLPGESAVGLRFRNVFDVDSILNLFGKSLDLLVHSVENEFLSHFRQFIKLDLDVDYPVTEFYPNGGYSISGPAMGYDFVLPFSTMLSTAMLTNFWVLILSVFCFLYKILSKLDQSVERSVLFLLNNPKHTLKWIEWIVVATMVYGVALWLLSF